MDRRASVGGSLVGGRWLPGARAAGAHPPASNTAGAGDRGRRGLPSPPPRGSPPPGHRPQRSDARAPPRCRPPLGAGRVNRRPRRPVEARSEAPPGRFQQGAGDRTGRGGDGRSGPCPTTPVGTDAIAPDRQGRGRTGCRPVVEGSPPSGSNRPGARRRGPWPTPREDLASPIAAHWRPGGGSNTAVKCSNAFPTAPGATKGAGQGQRGGACSPPGGVVESPRLRGIPRGARPYARRAGPTG